MSAPKLEKDTKLGAGLSMAKPDLQGLQHPAGPPVHGPMGQAERAFSAASTFMSGVLAISASQFIGAPLKLIDPKSYDGYMAWTKESFAVLCTTMTQWWAPTVVRVSGDESMRGQLFQMDDGSLRCNFPHRLVMMANHQLYTDWLYLWWIAYTNKMHGRIYIILKESIKNIPIFGWAAQFYNFIFLSRKWETDKTRFKRHLSQLSDPQDPMWLLIFPEGTNLSKTTREKSKAWAEKQGIADMKNLLLPRSTGLHFCLQELKKSTNWLYDCTIAYEGIPPGQYGQDIFTLRSSMFEGRPPKSVNMYWRRYRISDIPIESDEAFAMWLKNRWTEKDYLLEYFYKHGSFPEGDPIKAMQAEAAAAKAASEAKNGSTTSNYQPKHAKAISTEVRSNGWEEFLSIFGPITAAATAASSGELPEGFDFDALLSKVAQQQQMNLLTTGVASKAPKNVEEMRQALKQATKTTGPPLGILQQRPRPQLGPSRRSSSSVQNPRDALLAASRPRKPSTPSAPSKAGSTTTTSSNPATQRTMDPAIAKMLSDTHEQTRQALLKASIPVGPRRDPNNNNTNTNGTNNNNNNNNNIRNSAMKMTPTETAVTRPISTLAVNKAAARVKNATGARGVADRAAGRAKGTVAAQVDRAAAQGKRTAAAAQGAKGGVGEGAVKGAQGGKK